VGAGEGVALGGTVVAIAGGGVRVAVATAVGDGNGVVVGDALLQALDSTKSTANTTNNRDK
jgi:hypothetical protein